MSTPHCTFLFLKKENKLSSGLCYRQLKKCTLFDFGVNVFDMKVLLGTLFLRFLLETRPPFYVVIRATRRSNRLQYKEIRRVPSFFSYFKTLSISPAPGIEPATSRSAFKRSTDRDWANTTAVKILVLSIVSIWRILHARLFSLRRHTNLSKLKAAVACKIFDTVISPIPTYISEIWGVYAKPDFKTWDGSQRYTFNFVNNTWR